MKIILVRHGETDWNLKHIMQGITDIPLNEKGKEQALMVSKKLENTKIDVCFSSPLKRAVQTLNIITKVSPIIDNRLIERNMGELEGKNHKYYDAKLYWNYKINSNLYGVESISSLFKRVTDFFYEIRDKYYNSTVLIVSHGATIRALHYVISGYNEDTNFLDTKTPNCCVFEYDI